MNPVGLISLLVFGWLIVDMLPRFLRLGREIRRSQLRLSRDLLPKHSPKARVLLCLRGTDPFLDRCLSGLATQDYPDYGVTIVVDSPEDEALPQARQIQVRYGEDRINVIFRNRLIPTCSRRASSFISGLDQLGKDVEIIVMCDGDTVPHKSWLADLIRPLVEDGELATSGNRWYAPQSPDLGSVVRYYWNAVTVPYMYQHAIPWAGSMAIRREVFADPAYLDRLRHAFSEDTHLAGYLHPLGKRAFPQPGIPVINEELTSLRSFWGFLVRQMLAAKLHHQKWPAIFRTAMVAGLATWILLPLSIISGLDALKLWLIGMAIHASLTHICIGGLEWQIRSFLKQTRGQSLPRYGWRRLALNLPALVVFGYLYPVAVFAAAIARRHVWRGVTYDVLEQEVRVIHPDASGQTEESTRPTTVVPSASVVATHSPEEFA